MRWFGAAPGGDLLDRVTVAPLTAPVEEGSPRGGDLPFRTGWRLLRHPAISPEVFAVMEGSGERSGQHSGQH